MHQLAPTAFARGVSALSAINFEAAATRGGVAMRRFTIALTMVGLLALVPRPAQAQTYFVPFFGFDFGGDAGNCQSIFGGDCAVKRTAYGFSVGHLAGGIFGFEEDFSYAPDFFGTSTTSGSNSVLTLMSNLVVAVPAGPVHPYLTGGVGIVRTKVELNLAGLLSTSNTGFGYNLGGGVIIFLPSHLGVRVDFRHMRSASDLTIPIAGFTLPSAKLNFSRIYFGLVLH
jgi:opacity protein-like surface antigen